MVSLLDLSNELLLHICSFLDHAQIIELGRVCKRFESVSSYHKTWIDVDFCSRRYSRASFAKLLTPLLAPTEILKIRGLRNSKSSYSKLGLLSPHILNRLSKKCPKLKSLSIRESVECAKMVGLNSFASLKSLTHLSFINCEFVNKPNPINNGSWFRKIENHLPNLISLEVTGTSFVDDHDMMVIAKAQRLKKLILTNCVRVGLAIPYLAIAFRFGFQSLEYLDLRGTSMQDSDVQSILQTGNLKELYLGPMGKVKRTTINASNYRNLIMPDPQRDARVNQQVLVINIGPNGPTCRQAEDHELDAMDLGWVRQQNEERRRNAEEHPDHMYIGDNGNILMPERTDGASSSGTKRKAENEKGTFNKKQRVCEDGSELEEIVFSDRVLEGDSLGCVHDFTDITPDTELTDLLISYLIKKCTCLKVLHLAGCSISNEGLKAILENIPSLEYINIMCTNVTQDFVDQIRPLYVYCKISDATLQPRKPASCTIFCAS